MLEYLRREIEALKIQIHNLESQLADMALRLDAISRSDIDYIAMEVGIELEQEDDENES